MPRIIKKRIEKPTIETDTNVHDLMFKAKSSWSQYQRQIFIAISAVALIVLIVLGYNYYTTGSKEKAEDLFTEGYKYYHSLYGTDPLVKTDRLTRALDYFEKSYSAKPSPAALYYQAATLEDLSRYDDATAVLKQFASTFSSNAYYMPLAQYKQAMILVKQGKKEEALKAFEAMNAGGSQAYKDLALVEGARILRSLGRDQDARGKYQTIINEYPASSFVEEAAAYARPVMNTSSAGSASAPENQGISLAPPPKFIPQAVPTGK